MSRVEPVYPAIARKNGIHGAVRLDVVVGKDGRVLKIKLISGNPVFVDAAKDAVRQWVYNPTLLNGEPIEAMTRVCVPFVCTGQTPSPCGKAPFVRRIVR